MNTRWNWIALSIVAGLCAWGVWSLSGGLQEGTELEPGAQPLPERAEPRAPVSAESDAPRVPLAPAEPMSDAEAPPAAAAETWLVFFGRAVDGASGRPIPGARAVSAAYGMTAAADHEGLIELRLPQWRPGGFELSAEGYGERSFVPVAGYESPQAARRLELLPVAGLRVSVRDERGGPLGDLSVRLSARRSDLDMPDQDSILNRTFSTNDRVWNEACTQEGRCTFVGLPARVPFEAELLRGAEVILRAGSLALEPGEVREVLWRLNACARISGRLIDQDGLPVAAHELGRFAPSFAGTFVRSDELQRWGLADPHFEHAIARTKSDAEGRFAFEDVAPGTWWIGPRPGVDVVSELAPIAVRVELGSEQADLFVELRVDRGLFVRGTVETPDGGPPEHAMITAKTDGVAGTFNATVEKNGTFVIGPLVEGPCRLWAWSFGRYVNSPEVEVRAGEEGVVLRLGAGGRLEGVVVDAQDGAGVRTRLVLLARGESPSFLGGNADADGEFEMGGLETGTYDLYATAGDDRVGWLRGLEMTAGSTLGGLRVELRPGALVRVRYEGEGDYGGYSIRVDGIVVVGNSLKRGASQVHPVPPGAIEVRHTRGGEVLDSQRAELAAGDEASFVLASGDR